MNSNNPFPFPLIPSQAQGLMVESHSEADTVMVGRAIGEALRRGDVDGATALIRRFRRVGEPDSSLVTRLDLMLRCVRDGPVEANWSRLAQRDPGLILIASRLLSAGAAQPVCAEAGFTAVLANERAPSNERWGALLGLQGLLTAQGRLAKVRALLDSEGAAQVGGPVLYLIVAAAGAGLDDRAAEVADGFGTKYESMSTPILWALGTWAAHRTDTIALRAISSALTRKADSTGARADSLMARVVAAHAILSRGDSAAALDSIQALIPNAPLADIEWQPWESLGEQRLLLARLLLSRGDYAAAEPLLRRALSLQEKHLSPDDPSLALCLESCARLLRKAGKGDEAAELEARAKRIRTRSAEK